MIEKYKVLRNAEKFVIERKFSQAIKEYEKLVHKDSEDPHLLNTIGDLLIRVQDHQRALRHFRRVADIYLSNGFTLRSIATFKKIHHLDPDDSDINKTLVELFEKQGLKQDAKRHLEILVEQCQKAGQGLESIDWMERIVGLDPDKPVNLLRLADQQRDCDLGDEAAANYLAAANVLCAKGDYERAMEVSRDGLSVTGTNEELVEVFLESAQRNESLDEARAFLEAAREEKGAMPFLLYLGLLAEKQGDRTRAHRLYGELQDDGVINSAVSEGLRRTSADGSPKADAPVGESDVTSGVLEEASSDEAPAFEVQEQAEFEVGQEEWESGDAEKPAESAEEAGSGLFAPADFDDDTKVAEESGDEEDEPPAEEAAPVEEVTITSLEEALEEADFYLKLGFKDEAKRVLEVLLREYPQDDRVRRRAARVIANLPAPAEADASPEAPSSEPDPESFDEEIDLALDILFEPGEGGELDEVLRYDVERTSDSSSENPKVHYDLGLAYKEMGLADDAIQEFLSAIELLTEPENQPLKILCCSTLANSFLQLENYDESIEWARTGLGIPDMKDFEWKALKYDLGWALEKKGQTEEALECFQEIASRDAEYRDIQERLKSLEPEN